jgi:hypothetical protein
MNRNRLEQGNSGKGVPESLRNYLYREVQGLAGKKGSRNEMDTRNYLYYGFYLALSAYGCLKLSCAPEKLLINVRSNVRTKIWQKRNLIRGAYGQKQPYCGFLISGI